MLSEVTLADSCAGVRGPYRLECVEHDSSVGDLHLSSKNHDAGGPMPVSDAAGFCPEAVMANAGLTWTEERIERLTKLWTEGFSASQIAADLGGGLTRNAVLGKANRLGL